MEHNNIKHTNKCVMCGRSIVKFGRARKNGKYHNDWNHRELHKKCFIKKREEEKLDALYNKTLVIAEHFEIDWEDFD